MNYFLKNYYLVCAVVATVTTHEPLVASLSSMRRAATEVERNTLMPFASTDFKDFKDLAQTVASRLVAELKSAKITCTRKEKWDIFQQIRQHMIQYKNEHKDDLAIDRDGNRVAATLDRKESEFLYELITDLTAPFLIEDEKIISAILRQVFGTRTHNLPPMTDGRALAVSSDGSSVVTGSENEVTIYRYNSITNNWEYQHTINYINNIRTIAISSDGLTVVAGFWGGTIQIHRYNGTTHCWDPPYIINHMITIDLVAVSSDGLTVVAGMINRTARVYRFNRISTRWEYLHTITHRQRINSIAVSADGLTVVTGADVAQIHQYNKTGHRWELHTNYTSPIKAVLISSDGSSVVIGFENYTIQMYCFNRATNCWEPKHSANHTPGFIAIAVSLEGSKYTKHILRYNKITHCWEFQHAIECKHWKQKEVVSADGLTVVAGSKYVTLVYQLGLTEQQLQELIAIVCKNVDLALLIQNIHNQTKDFPSRIILTHEQQNSLLTLPLYALEMLLRRYAINTDDLAFSQCAELPEQISASSIRAPSGPATSSKYMERQKALSLLVKYKK